MERIAYELPEGTVFVDVLAAVEDRNSEGVFVFPALRVTTYQMEYDAAPGLVKLKGKRYSFDHVHVRTPWRQPWQGDSRHYHQRYTKTEAGNSLDWRSPTGKALRVLEESVRDRFVGEYPGWERESRSIRLMEMISREEGKAARALAEAAACDVRADKLRVELLSL